MAVEQFGPYRLDELIGTGGMGEVYRAYDTVKNRFVALKRLHPHLAADADSRARFDCESQLAARLQGRHIIPVHGIGEYQHQLYIDMRLVEGTDLAALLTENGGLPPARAVNILAQIASALDVIHAERLVHRDVKPSNVLFDATTGDDYVYLVDFGIAHETEAKRLTETGMVIGTPDYMAPERFLHGNADHRADIYSLACLLYESLTGRRPFPVNGLSAQQDAHRHLPPPCPSTARPDIPAGFDDVVARGMAKDPDQRYQSAKELAAAALKALSDITPQNDGPAETTKAYGALSDPQPPPTSKYPESLTWSLPWSLPEEQPPPRRLGQRVLTPTILIVVIVVALVITVFAGDDPASDGIGLIGSMPVDSDPVGVAVSPDGSRAYIVNNNFSLNFWSSDTVWVIDTKTEEVLATPDVGADAWDVAVSRDGSRAYVTNNNSNTVSVLDTRSNSVIDTLSVGERPEGVAVSPDGYRVYVTNNGSNTVSVIDTGTNGVTVIKRVIGTITVGDGPRDVAVSPDGLHAYVTNSGSGDVSVIDTGNNRVIDTISVRGSPWGVALSPIGHRAYVTNQDVGTVSVIDTVNGKPIPTPNLVVGDGPLSVAVSPDGRRIYVTNYGSDTVSVIDTGNNTVIKSIDVGDGPWYLAVSPDGRRVYVTNYGSNTVSVIDTGVG